MSLFIVARRMKKFFNNFSIPGYYKVAILDTLFILVFTVMPAIFGIFESFRRGVQIDLTETYLKGEIFLYCISFLSSSFLVFNQYKARVSDWKSGVNKMVMAMLAIISVFYASVTNNTDSSLTNIKWISWLFFSICLVIFFQSQLLSNKNSPDVSGERREDQHIIEEGLS